MTPAVITRPPIFRSWVEVDDDLPNCPEPPWPVPAGPLDSAQSRRAHRAFHDAKRL